MGGHERPDVAIFLPSMAGGGAERTCAHLARGLAAVGLRVELVLASATGPFLDEIDAEVEIVDLGSSRVRSAILPLARYLRERRPRTLLSGLRHANVAATIAREFSCAPVRLVVGEHNAIAPLDVALRSPVRHHQSLAAQLLYRRADAVVAVSRGVADDVRRLRGVVEERVWTIPNPVIGPTLRELAVAPSAHPWFDRSEPPVVLGVGRLRAHKDFRALIEAFASVRRRRAVRLVIAGDGPERASLQAEVRQHGFENDVDLVGFVENPYPLMAAAEVLVLPSRSEGLPTVLIEALALGTKVVSTDCHSGPRQILQEGRLGRLVAVGDVEALAEAIDHALDDPPTQLAPADLERFTVDAAVRTYRRVLCPPRA